MKTIIFLSLIISCSTMRLSVRAPYQSSKGNGSVTYERTYPVGGGIPFWCPLTIVFYGGACWTYLAMPFVSQENRFIQDAVTDLNLKLGTTDSRLMIPDVQRISWGSAEPYLGVTPAQ